MFLHPMEFSVHIIFMKLFHCLVCYILSILVIMYLAHCLNERMGLFICIKISYVIS